MPTDEEIRREYETCGNCGADLGGWAQQLAQCPLCGADPSVKGDDDDVS